MAYHRHFPRNTIPLSQTLEAWTFVLSIFFAIWLVDSGLIHDLVARTVEFGIIGSFIEGFFFTSILTTVPAVVAILESAHYVPAWELAVAAGLGAVCGDLLLFRFVQSDFVDRVLRTMLHPRSIKFGKRLSSGALAWIGPLLGVVVIASPLPDEIGLVMMGLSRISVYQFVPLSFAANAGGIFLMALAVQQLH